MIRKNLTILIILFAIMIPYVAKSQDHMKYSVLAIEYVGASDKPITPIVISDSSVGAEWFRTTVLKRSDLELTSVNVIGTSKMKALISVAEERGAIFQREQGSAQKPAETISVTIVKSQGNSSFLLSVSAAISMLHSFEALCRDDEPLQSALSHFQKRILPLK
jgi:hypothetical protein